MKKIHDAISKTNKKYLHDAIKHADVTENGFETVQTRSRFNYRLVLSVALVSVVAVGTWLFVLFGMKNLPNKNQPISPATAAEVTSVITEADETNGSAESNTHVSDDTTVAAGADVVSSDRIKYTEAYATDPEAIISASLNSEQKSDDSVPIFRLDTLNDLEAFKSQFDGNVSFDRGDGELPSFNEATADYGEDFFEQNSLVIAWVASSNGSTEVWLDDYAVNDDRFEMRISERQPDAASEAEYRFVILEVTDAEISTCRNFSTWKKVVVGDDTCETQPIAEETYNGLILTRNADTRSYTVIGYDAAELTLYVERNMIPEQPSSEETYYIPSSYNKMPITAIGAGAFKDCSCFNEIVIPDCVTAVGQGSFEGCEIKTVYFIPEGCTEYIGSKSLDYITVDKRYLSTTMNFDVGTIEALCQTSAGFIRCVYYESTKTFVLPWGSDTGKYIKPVQNYPEEVKPLIEEACANLREEYRSFASVPFDMLQIEYLPADNGTDTLTFEFCVGGMKTGCVFTYTKYIKSGEYKCRETHNEFSSLYQAGITEALMIEIQDYFRYVRGVDLTAANFSLGIRDGKPCLICSETSGISPREPYAYLAIIENVITSEN